MPIMLEAVMRVRATKGTFVHFLALYQEKPQPIRRGAILSLPFRWVEKLKLN